MNPESSFLIFAWSIAGLVMAGMWLNSKALRRRKYRFHDFVAKAYRANKTKKGVDWLKLAEKTYKAHRVMERRLAMVDNLLVACADFGAKVERLYWRFAHRSSCGLSGLLPDGAEVIRKELLHEEIIQRAELPGSVALAAAAHSPAKAFFWARRVIDVRLRCRKCGRLHFQQFSHFVPVSHE